MRLFDKPSRQRAPSFKEQHSFQERLDIRARLSERYPVDKYVMVVIEGLDEIDPKGKPFLTYLPVHPGWASNCTSPS